MVGRMPKKSDSTRYYDILNVSKTASADELRQAYKKAALKNHPDKGGDAEKFKELGQAYEALSDPEKRKQYDQYVHHDDSTKGGMRGGAGFDDPFNIFESFFRAGAGGSFGSNGCGDRPQRRGEDFFHQLQVSLEDLYNGTSKKLLIYRNVVCSQCKGSNTGGLRRCAGCQGTGTRPSYLGPYPKPVVCPDCRGSGVTMSEECGQCKGQNVVPHTKSLRVHIEKGMQDGQKITFHGAADEAPDTQTGDVVVGLQLQEHPKFKRKGDDLFVKQTVTSAEALCGFQFPLTHLDGRKLLIKTSPGEIVKQGQYKAVNDEGMPRYERPLTKGRLYFHFNVDDCFSPETNKMFEPSILRLAPVCELTDIELDKCVKTTLHNVDNIEHDIRRRQQQQQEAKLTR